MIKIIFILLVTIQLAGCVYTNTKLIKPIRTTSVIEFTKELRDDTSTLLDVVMVKIGNKMVKSEGFVSYKTMWCPRHENVNTTSRVIDKYRELCREKGGFLDSAFCRDSKNTDEVIFYASVKNTGKCTGDYSTADVVVVEPTGDRNAPDYMEVLRESGYRTKNEVLASKRRAEIKQHQAKIREKQRKASEEQIKIRDNKLMNNIGIQVCKNMKNRYLRFTYVGFVEQVNDPKIKIRVVDAQVGGRQGARPGGFQPHITWDYKQNWYVCE